MAQTRIDSKPSFLTDPNGVPYDASTPLPATIGAGAAVIGKVGLQVGGADVADTNAVPARSPQITLVTVTIANSGNLSGAGDLGTGRLVGIITPSTWTSAAITFSASPDGSNYYDLYDDATERTIASGSIPTSASRFFALSLSDWLGIRSLKIRSGTSGSPVSQGGARSVILVLAN